MIIDSHVNLHAPQFDEDQADVIARARGAGVSMMVAICDRLSNFDPVYDLATNNKDIWCTVGVHPHEAKDASNLEASALVALAGRDKVVGIGETGLDYFYDFSPRDIQRRVFSAHIEAARETGLPLVIHSRDADDDMIEMLEEADSKGRFKILLHCYTSGAELARRAAALGAWFSVSGIATFRSAAEVRAVIADMPGDRIIVETDCPYLAPVPMRGRRNEPAYVLHVLAKLAEIRGWDLKQAEAQTEAAFFGLFDRIPKP